MAVTVPMIGSGSNVTINGEKVKGKLNLKKTRLMRHVCTDNSCSEWFAFKGEIYGVEFGGGNLSTPEATVYRIDASTYVEVGTLPVLYSSGLDIHVTDDIVHMVTGYSEYDNNPSYFTFDGDHITRIAELPRSPEDNSVSIYTSFFINNELHVIYYNSRDDTNKHYTHSKWTGEEWDTTLPVFNCCIEEPGGSCSTVYYNGSIYHLNRKNQILTKMDTDFNEILSMFVEVNNITILDGNLCSLTASGIYTYNPECEIPDSHEYDFIRTEDIVMSGSQISSDPNTIYTATWEENLPDAGKTGVYKYDEAYIID